MRFTDKSVVVTGAGSGFGRQLSLMLAQEGAKVLVSDIDGGRADAASTWINDQANPDSTIPMTADVTNEDDMAALMKKADEAFGKIDIVFANAGIVSRGGVPPEMGGVHVDFTELTAEDWHNVMDVNITGVFYTCRAAVPYLRKNGGGSIVVTSSAASFVAYPSILPYTASKAAVNGFVRSLAFDLGKDCIRVNAVCPTHGMSPNFLMEPGSPVVGMSYEEMGAQMAGGWDPGISPIPLKRNRPPALSDNAKVALFLASDDAEYVTGQCMVSSDGGSLSRVAIWFQQDHVGAAGLPQD
jgi:NAD(P)-dependent dehydrogenase (short-subunit alcohol dehydrogenase family)